MSIDWGSELDRVEKATKPMTEGLHTFRIVEAKAVTAQTGNRMIKLTCKVEGGPDDGKMGYTNIVFTFDNPRAMKMTLRRLKALGVSDDMLKAENPSVEQIASKLIGRSAEGTVSHRTYMGEIQDDINFGVGSSTPGVVAPPVIPGPGPVGVPSIPPTNPRPQDEQPPAPVIEETPPTLAPAPDVPTAAAAPQREESF